MRKLPSLKALQAFEAAARHLSLSRAAEELFVSPGAVSQQVKLLEESLGTRLFERRHRQIVLTPAGESLMPGLSAAFDQMLLAVNQISVESADRPLTISSAPSLAVRWLVPRLAAFNKLHADIDVRLDTSTRLADLIHSDIDIGIRYGMGNYPGLNVDLLTCQNVFPVCSPALLTDQHPLKKLDDLRHHTLLHHDDRDDETKWPDWGMWLAAAGIDNLDFRHGPRFSDVTLLVDAAIRGQGVALAGSVSANDAIAAGQLVKPFDVVLSQEFAYYLVIHPGRLDEPKIASFRKWILQQFNEANDA